MKEWIKSTERLPEHNTQVLVRFGADVRLAVFDSVRKVFQVSASLLYTISENIEWIETLRPPDL
jgi:hypothetical protein